MEVKPSKFVTNKKLSTEKGLMDTLLSRYFDQRTAKEGPKTLLKPWLDHPGKTLEQEIDELIDGAGSESVELTPKNESNKDAGKNAARKGSDFEKATSAGNPAENAEEKKNEVKVAES